MKTTKLIYAVILFFIAFKGVATETPKLTIVQVENRKAVISFESTSPTNFELLVKNDAGNVVNSIKSDRQLKYYNEVFDFGKYEGRNFKVTINYGNKSVNRQLKFNPRNELKVETVEHLYEPYMRFRGDKLNISFLNISQKNVYINFYQEGEFVTGKYLGNEMCIQKSLDLSQLESGTYETVLNEYLNDHKFIVQK